MSNWRQVEPQLVEAVGSLPRSGTLMLQRDYPGCQLMFSRLPGASGEVLRAEVCNDDPQDNERIRARGWELTDMFAGVWRREVPWPTDEAQRKQAVAEATHVLRNVWGEATLAGFVYHAWIENSAPPAWKFWAPKKDTELRFPNLGLPQSEA